MNDPRATKLWDISPQKELMDPVDDCSETLPTFEASINAHGMYETMRFVLRLSPRNHELVDSITSGQHSLREISSEALQAYSTYIHETVHWWQHVGSTSGLLLSLSYLGQTHANIAELQDVIATFGCKKPLKRWTDDILLREGHGAQFKLAKANFVVNNVLDVEYYRCYAHRPKQSVAELVEKIHFESIGHSYHVAYGQLIGLLSAAMDSDLLVLPNPVNWEDEFTRLNQEKYEGFYYGSPVYVPPVGLHAVYEGQARFVQLQLLNATHKKIPSCQEWRDMGYLSGIYVEAFEKFLELSESTWPENLDDPIIGLFLLICDLAINPTRGFPLDIENFEDFITDVDVGVRFTRLSRAVAYFPHLRTAIRSHSREEYVAVSKQLAVETGYDDPLIALEEVVRWVERSPGLAQLMSEHKTFEFGLTNLPIRVFFSHFVSFARDKLAHPECFCWPGAWMVGSDISNKPKNVWQRHQSLFTDRGDRPGVYPRKWPGRDEKMVQAMFNDFYNTMAIYDLTRQWILKEGPFVCDFTWLAENYSQEHADAWANNSFNQVFGVTLGDFEILPRP